MRYDLENFNRNSLTLEQQIFLCKIIPLAQLIQDWIINKAQFAKKPSKFGLFPSLVISEIIIQSQWGEHVLSKEEYNNRYSNNLCLLESDKFWIGKKHKYQDKVFRAYKDWGNFATDFTDYVVFSGLFDDILKSNNLEDQLIWWGRTKQDSSSYSGNMELLISFFNLKEFDK